MFASILPMGIIRRYRNDRRPLLDKSDWAVFQAPPQGKPEHGKYVTSIIFKGASLAMCALGPLPMNVQPSPQSSQRPGRNPHPKGGKASFFCGNLLIEAIRSFRLSQAPVCDCKGEQQQDGCHVCERLRRSD